MTEESNSTSGFREMGISHRLLEALAHMKIVTPTQIQQRSIPVGLQGHDLLGIAQTGTGKTLAFGIPLLQRLDQQEGDALVLLPTRELAQQVHTTLTSLGRVFGLKTAVLIGGVAFFSQRQDLRNKPRIIIATPGRLLDMMEQKEVNLGNVSILVLDEADRMFDMGFAPQLNRILKVVPKKRQTMLFSATMPASIVNLATSHMQLPVRVEVAPAGSTAERIEQNIFIIRREAKLALLQNILQNNEGTSLVFSRTKHGAKKITAALRILGYKSAEIHSNRSQAQRREALAGFKAGRYTVLVATDIAARGIDVPNIACVINFDLPDNPEDYVHRIGRTGRAGQAGKAISFATPDQRHEIRIIEKLIRKNLTIAETPKLEGHENIPALSEFSADKGGKRGGGGKPGFGKRRSGSGGGGRFFKGRGSRGPSPNGEANRKGFRGRRNRPSRSAPSA